MESWERAGLWMYCMRRVCIWDLKNENFTKIKMNQTVVLKP
jgi:hypothetical protein